jgi:hypothetical protein
MTLAALAVLTAAIYLEENWRGSSAWKTAKVDLEGQQEKLDWAAYIPPAAPDDQNFFKAPKMQEWFTGKGSNELTARLSLNTFAALASRQGGSNASAIVAELIVRPPGTGATPPGVEPPPAEILPLVKLDKLSLSEAIGQLARQANLNVQIDPLVAARPPGPDGKPGPLIRVTGQWTNVSALSVLMALQCDHNLCWVDDPKTGVPVIKNAGGTAAAAGAGSLNHDYVLAMIRAAIGPVGEIAEGFALSGNDLAQNPPRRLSIAPDSVPTRNELARLYPGTNALQVQPAGNSLRVLLTSVPVAAADYLKWSDQFAPEFDKIRQAVQRPSARLDGDYGQFYRVPVPNLTALRAAAFRLAGRGQAFLMRGQPEEALRELTLLHDLRGCMANKPAGNPMTLPWAMANLAVAGVYVECIDSGLRWQVWRDAELAALEDQLSRLDLVSPVWCALESARAGDCHLLESGSRTEVARVFGISEGKTHLWQKITSPSRVAVQFMPRGWLYQNMANGAVLDQKRIDSVDRLQGVIRPHQVEDAGGKVLDQLQLHRHSFYWFLAKDLNPPLSAPLKTTAFAQCAANQALVVCALERCRLARGEFPAALRDLIPQFIPILPMDPVNGESFKYRTTAAGRFLLYSIGWDEKDDNGTPVDAGGKGDWVWGRL